MKKCVHCLKLKIVNNFSKNSRAKDKLNSWCKECKRKNVIEWYKKYPEKQYYKLHPEYGKRRYYKNQVSNTMASRIRKALKGERKSKHWELLVDYTLNELKQHLQDLFREGMTWENYGTVWHIDHKRPISSFKNMHLGTQDFLDCWSLSNLQPLFKLENLRKYNKL